MRDLNTVILVGRQTREIGENDFGYTSGGTARLTLSLAVNNTKREGDQYVDDPSFVNVTVWGKTAENIRGFIAKGKQIAIQGHIQQQRWETQDGQKRQQLAVIADTVELLSSRGDGQPQTNASRFTAIPAQQPQQSAYANQYAQQQQAYAQQQTAPQQVPPQVQQVAQQFGGQVIDENEIPWG